MLLLWWFERGGGLCSYWNTIFLILQMMKNQGSIYISDWENVNRYSVTFFSLFTAVDSRSQKAVKYEFLINPEQRTEEQLLFFKFHSNYNSEVQSIKSLSFGWHFNWELFHAYNIGKKISSSTGNWGWQTVELQLYPYKICIFIVHIKMQMVLDILN